MIMRVKVLATVIAESVRMTDMNRRARGAYLIAAAAVAQSILEVGERNSAVAVCPLIKAEGAQHRAAQRTDRLMRV